MIVDRWTKIAHFLPLIEIAFKNSYHASIEMTPYEALYRRKYRSPLCWEVGERQLIGLELVKIISEEVPIIQQTTELCRP